MRDNFILITKLSIGMIINIILTILSYIIPKDRTLVLLGSYRTFAGNTKAFYLYLLNFNTNYKPVWITHDKKIYQLLLDRNMSVVYIYTIKAFVSILRANYLILTHGPVDVSYFYFLFGRFNMVQTWHGIALKDISTNAENNAPLYFRLINKLSRLSDKHYKLIIATSEETKEIFRLSFNNNNVKIVGYPRNDIFYNKSLIFEDYKEKFRLYNFNRVILYSPTFRENNTKQPFSQGFLTKLDHYLKTRNYLLLIKRHPYDNFILNSNDNNYSNIVDVSVQVIDIQDLLPNIDILITDYSSIIFDFILTNKPIIFYPYDFDEYIRKCRRLNYNYFDELPGPFAIDEEELLKIIGDIDTIFNSKVYQRRYNCFKDKYHYYQDGKSCERLYTILFSNKLI